MIVFFGEVKKNLIKYLLIVFQVTVISSNSFAENKERFAGVEEKIIDVNWGSRKGEIGAIPESVLPQSEMDYGAG